MWGLSGHCKGFGFYPEFHRKPLDGFEYDPIHILKVLRWLLRKKETGGGTEGKSESKESNCIYSNSGKGS